MNLDRERKEGMMDTDKKGRRSRVRHRPRVVHASLVVRGVPVNDDPRPKKKDRVR